MFIAQETQLGIAYPAARSCLVTMVLSGSLGGVSQAAYQAGLTTLIRVGPFGDVPAASRLVRVRFLEPADRDDGLRIGLRWEATGVTAGLFPVLDGDFTLAPAGADTTLLALAGVYRPPLGHLGAALDGIVLRKVARATIRSLLRSVATAITEAATDAALTRPRGQPLPDDGTGPDLAPAVERGAAATGPGGPLT